MATSKLQIALEEQSIIRETKYHEKRWKNAFKLDFAAKDDDVHKIRAVFDPIMVEFGILPPPQHILQAALQRWATNAVIKWAETRHPIVAIGPNVLSERHMLYHEQAHGCTLFTGRDQTRHASAAASPTLRGCNNTTYLNQVNQLASGITTEKFCTTGFENCDFQAPFAVSVHSLYDISPANLALGFVKHGTRELKAYMHIHPAVLMTDSFYDANTLTRHQIERVDGVPKNVLFSFANDSSFCYRHDYDNVIFYTTRNGFNTGYGFGILIETVNRMGSQYELKVTRCEIDEIVTSYRMLSDINIIKIPNIVEMAKVGFNKAYYDGVPYLWADKQKVTKLVSYLMARDPKQMSIRVAYAYARSEMRCVKLGERIVDYTWEINSPSLTILVICIYVMCLLKHAQMNAVADASAKEIAKLSRRCSWLFSMFPTFCLCLQRMWKEVKEIFGRNSILEILTQESNMNIFADLEYQFLEDLYFTDIISTEKYVQVINHLPLPTQIDSSFDIADFVLGEPNKPITSENKPEETIHYDVYDSSEGNSCLFFSLFGLKAEREFIVMDLFDRISKIDSDPHKKELELWLTNFYAANDYKGSFEENIITHENDMKKPTQRYFDEIALFLTFYHYENLKCYSDGKYIEVKPIIDIPKAELFPIIANIIEHANHHFIGKAIKKGGSLYGISFDNAAIKVESVPTSWVIVHGVHNRTRDNNSKPCGYNGFANTIMKHTRGGPDGFINTLLKHKEVWGDSVEHSRVETHTQTDSRVINIIAANFDAFKVRFDDFLLNCPSHTTYHLPLVGNGVWQTSKGEYGKVNRKWLTAIHKKAQAKNIALVFHGKVERFTIVNDNGTIHYPCWGEELKIANSKDLREAFKDEELAAINTSLYKQYLAENVPEALRDVLKKASLALEDFGSFTQKNIHPVDLVTGPPGSGKTADVLKKNKHLKSILYIAPTNTLAIDSAAKMAGSGIATTIHKAIHNVGRSVKPQLIIIDEAYTVPFAIIGYFATFAPVTLIGDKNQIGFIDFNACGPVTLLRDVDGLVNTTELKITRRCPKDIVELPIIKKIYPKITTQSNVKTSIEFVGPHAKFPTTCQRMVFSQQAKSLYEGSMTVHEAQGSTFETAVLTFTVLQSDKTLLKRSLPHLVVGFTRHTKKLYVQEESPGLFENAIAIHLGEHVELDIAMKETNVALPEFCQLEPVDQEVVDADISVVKYAPCPVAYEAITTILSQVYPVVTGIYEYQRVEKEDLEYKGGATGVLHVDDIKGDELQESRGHEVRKFPGHQYVKVTNSSSRCASAHTFLSRYTRRTKQLKEEHLKRELEALQEIVTEFIDLSYTEIDKEEVFAEAIEAFTKRGHDVGDLKDIDCWTDQGIGLVKFAMKTQQKQSGEDPLHKDKAGQGIAAWEKTLNFHLIVWVRLLERCMRRSKRIVFCSGQTDEEILKLLDAKCTGQNYKYFENDFEEFDSTQNNLEHMNFITTLRRLGCPELLLGCFGNMMFIRTVTSMYCTILVRSKKDSGRVDTLAGNTLFNLCVLLSMFDKESRGNIVAAFFKGDDSKITFVRDLIIDFRRKLFLEEKANYKLKMSFNSSAEFTNTIVNYNGSAINLPKLAAKVFSRYYTTEAKFLEYQTAVKDLMRTCNDTHTAAVMCKVNAVHHGITTEQADTLVSALINFANGGVAFDSLIKFNLLTKRERTVVNAPISGV
uniref:Nonstructural polyprotein n=1 Tax=Avian associated hepe-like virus 10 TaxID=2996224 RepID=A0A9E9FWE1_9VIRU|nr:MAG: nonstructural polyprotein [Avian associated hepe-like virus 10]